MEHNERERDVMSKLLSEETKRTITIIQETKSVPYFETKRVLDDATKKTVKILSDDKRSLFSFLNR